MSSKFEQYGMMTGRPCMPSHARGEWVLEKKFHVVIHTNVTHLDLHTALVSHTHARQALAV